MKCCRFTCIHPHTRDTEHDLDGLLFTYLHHRIDTRMLQPHLQAPAARTPSVTTSIAIAIAITSSITATPPPTLSMGEGEAAWAAMVPVLVVPLMVVIVIVMVMG